MAITRYGETIGYYNPSRDKESAADIASLKAAVAKLDAMLKAAQIDTEEIVAKFKAKRRKK